MALTRMLQRRGTFSQWDAVKEDLVLQAGEIGLETNTGKFKIGNGVDDWATLDYIEDDGYNLAKYARIGTALAPIDQTLYGTRTIEGKDLGLTTFVIDVPAGITADYIQEWQKNSTFVAGVTATGGMKLSDDLDMSGQRILDLPIPTLDQEAASKIYVDEMVAGLAWKEAAHLFSNSNVALTGSTNTLIIDGHDALVAADSGIYRIILNAQSTATENGVYLYTDNGTTYTLVRTDDAQTADQLQGASIYVQEGTTYGTSSWVQSNYNADTFDELVWVQFSGAALITDGAGLLKEGNTLSVIGTANRISVTPDNVDIDANYVGQTSITTLGTVTSGIWEAQKIAIEKGGTGATSASGALTNLGLTATAAEINTLGGIIAPSGLETRLAATESDVSDITTELNSKASLTSANTFSGNQTVSGSIVADNYQIPVSVEASNSIALDFASGTGLHSRSANGNVTVTVSAYKAGMTKTLFIVCDGTSRSLTFPSGWVFVGSKPTSILANKTGVLTVTSLGTAEANAVASWVAQV